VEANPLSIAMHMYEVRPRKDDRGVDLISDGLPFSAYHSGERARLAKNESLKKMKA
jgi:hypothetical protein